MNAGPGDQVDPHVSGDWVVYQSDLSIRYYNFATSVDAQIPMDPLAARDLLSDVSGSRIVFSRVFPEVTTPVMVFDAATPTIPPREIDPASGVVRLGSAIGGDTIAYIDYGLHGNGELVIHDLVSSTSVRITTDTNVDHNPQVSPDGNVVAWEHCASSFSICDIWQAVKSGAVWSISVASGSLNPEANPDSNGTLVVYESFRGSKSDFFWRPVGGGAEAELRTPGFNANPSIAVDYIAFESRPTQPATSDIFVYDMVSNQLFQITDTPLITEQLNDITVLPDGSVRVVWASDDDGPSQRDINAATFVLRPADSTAPVITQPSDIVADATMPSGAVVTFSLEVTDDVGVVSIVCVPPSGSVFSIGASAVQCIASDAAGNSADVSFNVRVKGAAEQIVDLVELSRGISLPPLIQAKLRLALQTALANPRSTTLACAALGGFILLVQSQPHHAIAPAKKAQLIADAIRIRAVLGCP